MSTSDLIWRLVMALVGLLGIPLAFFWAWDGQYARATFDLIISIYLLHGSRPPERKTP